uniref:GPI-anchored protein LLG1-like domain-containing protein n=1 Tax=Hordeum vulgare subsp. vulgare TaxID=112509 RepID=A0A8I6WQE3_HORVV
MGSAGVAAVLLSCVGLSMASAGSAASEKPLILSSTYHPYPQHTFLLLFCIIAWFRFFTECSTDRSTPSDAALEAAPPEASPSSARKLGGFPVDAGMCPVHLDHMKLMGNVQSSCVGQTIPQRRCCAAFKNFLCPYRATLNDIDNGCAARMMARIHQLCQVPKGYFVMCGDTPDGITC